MSEREHNSGDSPFRKREALRQLRQERDDLNRTVASLYRINQQLEEENERLKGQRNDLLDRINRLEARIKAKGV